MSDQDHETHPLDRDYSVPLPAPEARELTATENLRRFGVIVFALGFFLVVVAAITLGMFRGGGWIESFASSIHRFAMFAILSGGILIIVSYRLPLPGYQRKKAIAEQRRASLRTLGLLLVWNVMVTVVIVALVSFIRATSSLGFMIFFNGLLTAAAALMVTMIVWNRSILRAFAIGVLVALLMPLLSFSYFPAAVYGSSGLASLNDYGVMIGRLLAVQFSGMICATYVALVFPQAAERK